tara:strand:- start:251 stop:907 length:657 start_codon:yes stop_codon:yes gene_type:complete
MEDIEISNILYKDMSVNGLKKVLFFKIKCNYFNIGREILYNILLYIDLNLNYNYNFIRIYINNIYNISISSYSHINDMNYWVEKDSFHSLKDKYKNLTSLRNYFNLYDIPDKIFDYQWNDTIMDLIKYYQGMMIINKTTELSEEEEEYFDNDPCGLVRTRLHKKLNNTIGVILDEIYYEILNYETRKLYLEIINNFGRRGLTIDITKKIIVEVMKGRY